MKTNRKFSVRKVVMGLVLFLVLSSARSLFAKQCDPNTVIATIDDRKITCKEIKVDPRFVKLSVCKGEDLEGETLRKTVQHREFQKLANIIQKHIYKAKIAQLGITVSEQEVNLKADEMLKENGFDEEMAEKMRKSFQALHAALIEYKKDPSKEDEIYEKYLAGSLISKRQWKLEQVLYDRPGNIKRFEMLKNFEDMKKIQIDVARDVLHYDKLIQHILKEAQQQKGKDQIPCVETKYVGTTESEALMFEKQEIVREWFKKAYKEFDVKIIDGYFVFFDRLCSPPVDKARLREILEKRISKDIVERGVTVIEESAVNDDCPPEKYNAARLAKELERMVVNAPLML